MKTGYTNKPTKEGIELLQAATQACRCEFGITDHTDVHSLEFGQFFRELRARMAFEGFDMRGAPLVVMH